MKFSSIATILILCECYSHKNIDDGPCYVILPNVYDVLSCIINLLLVIAVIFMKLFLIINT